MIMGYEIYLTHLNISGYNGIIWDIEYTNELGIMDRSMGVFGTT